MIKWDEYLKRALTEACDGSGKEDGTGKKKRKQKGKEDKEMSEAVNSNEKFKKEIMHQIGLLRKSVGFNEDNNNEWVGPALAKIEDVVKKIK